MKIEDIEKLNKIADDEINVYSLEVIDGVVKEEICKEILTTCGIAEDVAPYIEFLKEDEGGFKKLNEFIKKNSSDDEWETELFDDMYIIGFHDNNYITLDKEGRVMYVDYETMTKELVNNSLEKFFDIIIKFNFIFWLSKARTPSCIYLALKAISSPSPSWSISKTSLTSPTSELDLIII
mgnify:CR=1 FL=1